MNVNKVIVGVGLVGVGLIGTGVALAQDSDPVVPKTSVGISIDAKDDLTETNINCYTEGQDGRFNTVDGDGTLFMENREPHTMRCIIQIKRVGTIT